MKLLQKVLEIATYIFQYSDIAINIEKKIKKYIFVKNVVNSGENKISCK